MKPGAGWPIAIVAVLGITVAANAVLLYEASDRNSQAIEPDYYRKAIAWDSTAAERDRSAALGWRADARLEPGPSGTLAVVTLRDRAGGPVTAATVTVHAIHDAEATRIVPGVLLPRRDGTYAAVLPLERRGLWELRIDARRGEQRFERSLRVELAEPR